MEHLQAQLRDLRSQQKRTLSEAATLAGIETKWLCGLESRYPRSSSLPSMERLAQAYGVSVEEITTLFSAEYRRRGYLDREELPVIARRFFTSGNFVVLDLETTSANPHAIDAEIVDIAIVDEDGIPLVSTLVKPSQPIPEATIEIHGITDEMVKDAPTFQEVYPKIVQAIAGKTLIVYNSDYDVYLLDNLINRNTLDMPHFDNWCLMRAYADYRKRPSTFSTGKGRSYQWIKLVEACQLESVVLTDAHRALGDTLATYGLLKVLAMKVYPVNEPDGVYSRAQMQTYNALSIAAEHIGANNYLTGRYMPRRSRNSKSIPYRITEEHQSVIDAMSKVLSGDMSPEEAMFLLHDYGVQEQRGVLVKK